MADTITDQPGHTGFSAGKVEIPGLEVLASLQELKIKQLRPGCLELLQCCELKNKYNVQTEQGTRVFFLEEESNFFMRCCCTNLRELEISFQDPNGQELLRFSRPLRCSGCFSDCCYPSCTQLLEVLHKGEVLGRIREVPVCLFTSKHLEVFDKHDEKIYDISGPCLPIGFFKPIQFQIENQGGISVGEITKLWGGCIVEAWTDKDSFKVEFPDFIDVTKKALLIGAAMLVDYMYFEENNNKNSMHFSL